MTELSRQNKRNHGVVFDREVRRMANFLQRHGKSGIVVDADGHYDVFDAELPVPRPAQVDAEQERTPSNKGSHVHVESSSEEQ